MTKELKKVLLLKDLKFHGIMDKNSSSIDKKLILMEIKLVRKNCLKVARNDSYSG